MLTFIIHVLGGLIIQHLGKWLPSCRPFVSLVPSSGIVRTKTVLCDESGHIKFPFSYAQGGLRIGSRFPQACSPKEPFPEGCRAPRKFVRTSHLLVPTRTGKRPQAFAAPPCAIGADNRRRTA
jgi:hypothetical protein